ncbi:MAG: Hsp20/alpha crystallin family protein [Candidatus Uhrbacteria bacterium]|nr:Hsp20/alpha crystallin family protein [Candidatus Uhrbacteria bacterium]
MRLVPWKPLLDGFDGMELFMQPYRSMMSMTENGIVPPVDMYEHGNVLIVETPLAGIDPAQVEVTVDGDVLTIKGSTERKTEIDEKNYYRKEVRSGSVFRQIPLPIRVLGEQASASYEQGVLKIEIPKATADHAKSIKIQVKGDDQK